MDKNLVLNSVGIVRALWCKSQTSTDFCLLRKAGSRETRPLWVPHPPREGISRLSPITCMHLSATVIIVLIVKKCKQKGKEIRFWIRLFPTGWPRWWSEQLTSSILCEYGYDFRKHILSIHIVYANIKLVFWTLINIFLKLDFKTIFESMKISSFSALNVHLYWIKYLLSPKYYFGEC